MRVDSYPEPFSINLDEVSFVGHQLSRPECILAEPNGTLWVSDNRGGVTRLDPSGEQTIIGNIPGTPNGLALEPSGQLLIADISAGAVHRLARTGEHHTLLDQLSGEPLGAVNFVYFDQRASLGIFEKQQANSTAPRLNRKLAKRRGRSVR